MADKWLVKSGNTSDPTVWNDGTLPGATDDCYADGFTGTIDEDLTVASVQTTQRTGGTAGGGWVLPNGVTLTADVYAGTNDAHCISPSGTCQIIGNVYGGSRASGIYVGGLTNLNVTGNLYGGVTSSSNAIWCIGGGSGSYISVTGSVFGGSNSGASCHGILIQGAVQLLITGDIIAGSQSAVESSTTTYVLDHIGTITASATRPGLVSPSPTATNRLSGPFYNFAQINAVAVQSMTLRASPSTQWTFFTEDLTTDRTLYSAETLPGQPAESDVRKDTVYGPSSELTGTLAVPPASAVGVGVPVDNTVGTAAVTTAAIQAALTSQGLTEARAGYLDKLNVAGELANTDNAASFKATGFAVPGSAMALSADERIAIWTLEDGIETNVTPKQALQRIGAIVAGKVSGAGTDAELFVGMDGETNRVLVQADSNGNRTAVEYDPG